MTSPARPGVALALMLAAALAGLSGCGRSSRRPEDRIGGTTLTIYSSAPLQGAPLVEGRAVVNGERLALSHLHDRIGRYRIALVSLDDATLKRRGSDPGQTSVNARRAVADPSTIGYLGELDAGASAVSIPVLNRAGIPQISATSTAVGLTSGAAGASPGEPNKYYPTRVRTFARVIPNDSVQAVAQVRLQRGAGCATTFVLDDGEVDGHDAAVAFQTAAASDHLRLAGIQTFDPQATDYTSLARTVAQTGADCLLISAATQSNAVLLTEQLARALPRALLFGTAGLAESGYANPARGGIPLSLDDRVTLTGSPPPAAPGGPAFLAAYRRRFGEPAPDAVLGYEAMSLLLDALSRATANGTRKVDRGKVLHAVFAARRRPGAIGTYSIDRQGDTTLRRFGVYGVSGGKLRFLRAIEV